MDIGVRAATVTVVPPHVRTRGRACAESACTARDPHADPAPIEPIPSGTYRTKSMSR